MAQSSALSVGLHDAAASPSQPYTNSGLSRTGAGSVVRASYVLYQMTEAVALSRGSCTSGGRGRPP